MERELTTINTMFKKKRIHKYTFVRMVHGRERVDGLCGGV